MPTRDTRTHASMTMPLSRTRSRTSMRLVPPAARSTAAIQRSPSSRSLLPRLPAASLLAAPAVLGPRVVRCRQDLDLALERLNLRAKLVVLDHRPRRPPRRQIPVVPPPVEAD